MANKQESAPAKGKNKESSDDNKYLCSDASFSSSEGGAIKKVSDFSGDQSEGSDSSDCVVETDTKVKSTGFFHKLRLRDMLKN